MSGKHADEAIQFSAARTQPVEGYLRTADVISALSLAADLALGLPAEHAARSCYMAMAIGSELNLSHEHRGELYYTALLLDAGCTAWASTFAAYVAGDEITARQELFFGRDAQAPLEVIDWLRNYMAVDSPLAFRAERILHFVVHGRQDFRDGFRNTCEVSNRFARRLGMPSAVQEALLYVFEQWDGKGMPNGRRKDAIPMTARIAYPAIFLEVCHRKSGRDAAVGLARERRGKAFDPMVINAFLAACDKPDFWDVLERETVLDVVRSLEPDLPIRFLHREKLLDVALFAADFADIKSPFTIGHSRRVARLTVEVSRRIGLSERDTEEIHLAALLHDLGLVAIPSFVLEKPTANLTQSEREALRLHPYHAERILSRVPALERVATIVSAHHERMDGRGYFRGLAGTQIPLAARIIALADAFDDLTHETPSRPAWAPEAAIAQMRPEVGPAYDPDAFAALLDTDAIGQRIVNKTVPRQRWPAGLTAREVEVLCLAAKGLTRKQMADRLSLSESTVRSHLEHIYDKIDVSTRVAATLFAMEHNLIT